MNSDLAQNLCQTTTSKLHFPTNSTSQVPQTKSLHTNLNMHVNNFEPEPLLFFTRGSLSKLSSFLGSHKKQKNVCQFTCSSRMIIPFGVMRVECIRFHWFKSDAVILKLVLILWRQYLHHGPINVQEISLGLCYLNSFPSNGHSDDMKTKRVKKSPRPI